MGQRRSRSFLVCLAGLLVVASCGGSDNRTNPRNAALNCIAADVTDGSPGESSVLYFVELRPCQGVTAVSLSFDGINFDDPHPFGDGDALTKGLTVTDQKSLYVRSFGSDGSIVATEIVTVTRDVNAPNCAGGGVCAIGDAGPGGGVIVSRIIGPEYGYLEARIGKGDAEVPLTPAPVCDAQAVAGEPVTPPAKLTGDGMGAGPRNTEMMLRGCKGEYADLLAQVRQAGGKTDWMVPSAEETLLIKTSGVNTTIRLDSPVLSSSLVFQENGVVMKNALSDDLVTTMMIPPGMNAQFIPVRLTTFDIANIGATVAVTLVADTPQQPDPQADPQSQPGAGAADPGTSSPDATTPDAPQNLEVTYDPGSDTVTYRFDYPDASMDKVSSFRMTYESGLPGDVAVSRGVFRADKSEVGSGTRRSFTTPATFLQQGASYMMTVSAVGESDTSAMAFQTGLTFDRVPPANGPRPVAPTSLGVKDETSSTFKLTWTSAHGDASVFQYRVSYSYPAGDGYEISGVSELLSLNEMLVPRGIFRVDTEVKFTVVEVGPADDWTDVSTASESFAFVPNPAKPADPEGDGSVDNEIMKQTLETCAATPAKLVMVGMDRGALLTEPTTDSEGLLVAKHPCSREHETSFVVSEVNPVTGEVLWSRTSFTTPEDPDMFIHFDGLLPGKHVFHVSTFWEHDGTVYFGKINDVTYEVAQGKNPVTPDCSRDKVSLKGSVITVDCEGVLSVSVFELTRGYMYSEGNSIDVSAIGDGWVKGVLSVTLKHHFDDMWSVGMVCVRKCESSFSPEFDITVDGDQVKATVTQNKCGGDPAAELEEFTKLTDGLYLSYNRTFGVEETQLTEGKTASLTLQKSTGGLLAERDDYCVDAGRRVYSFVELNRQTEPAPFAEETAGNTTTKTYEVPTVAAVAQTVAVPESADSVTISPMLINELRNGFGIDVESISVRVDGGKWIIVNPADLNRISLKKDSKVISFRLVPKVGKPVQVSKVISRVPSTTVGTSSSGGSTSRTLWFVIGATVLVLGAGLALARRTPKA